MFHIDSKTKIRHLIASPISIVQLINDYFRTAIVNFKTDRNSRGFGLALLEKKWIEKEEVRTRNYRRPNCGSRHSIKAHWIMGTARNSTYSGRHDRNRDYFIHKSGNVFSPDVSFSFINVYIHIFIGPNNIRVIWHRINSETLDAQSEYETLFREKLARTIWNSGRSFLVGFSILRTGSGWTEGQFCSTQFCLFEHFSSSIILWRRRRRFREDAERKNDSQYSQISLDFALEF